MGADRETYKLQQIERKDVTYYELFIENVQAYNTFRALETQFRYVVANKVLPTGLDYSAVISYLDRFYEEEEVPELMNDIKIIETHYLKARHG